MLGLHLSFLYLNQVLFKVLDWLYLESTLLFLYFFQGLLSLRIEQISFVYFNFCFIPLLLLSIFLSLCSLLNLILEAIKVFTHLFVYVHLWALKPLLSIDTVKRGWFVMGISAAWTHAKITVVTSQQCVSIACWHISTCHWFTSACCTLGKTRYHSLVLQLCLNWNATWSLVRIKWAINSIASKVRHLTKVVILLACYDHIIQFEKVLSPAPGVVVIVQLSNVRVFLSILEWIYTFPVQSWDWNLRGWYNLLA